MRKVKTIKGATNLARFIATLKTKPNGLPYVAGYMPSHLLPVAPRYSSTPAWAFYRIDAKGFPCVTYIETAQNTFEVWEADADADVDSIMGFVDAEAEYMARAS